MKVIYLGHSGFLIEIDGQKICFDPFLTGNPKAANIDVGSIQADYMLLSHGHGDHVSDAIAIAKNSGCQVAAGYEVANWLGANGIENAVGLNHGGTIDLGPLKAKFVSAIHSSSLPDGSYGGFPGGWVIYGSQNFYYAGDTALTMDMKLIPQTGPKMDLAFLPIGDHFTMGYQDASLAAEFVETQKVIGMHFDTFPPIEIDHQEAKSSFSKKGIELILMEIGSMLEV